MEITQYLDVFIDESTEHLDVLYKQLLELEKNPTEKPIIEEIFRAAHTLKGMSATMGYHDLANLTHKLENIFDGIRYDQIQVKADMMDTMFSAVDHLNEMVEDVAAGGNGERNITEVAALLDTIENGTTGSTQSLEGSAPEHTHSLKKITKLDEFELSILAESVERGYSNYEVTVNLREDCLLKGVRVFMVFDILEKMGEVIKSDPPAHDLEEENFEYSFTVILVSKFNEKEIEEKIKKISEVEYVSVNHFSVSEYKKEIEMLDTKNKETEETDKKSQEPIHKPRATTSNKTIRVNIERLDILMNLFEELVIDRGRLEQISVELQHQDLQETVERMSRVSGDLQSIILQMRMVPINQVFSRFPSMMRNLARDLHKQVQMEIVGAETELDRTVIDEIGDPLVHLLRNAIDHGIESPEEREKAGKPEQGTIILEAYHSGNHVFIEIRDNGAGINKEKVLKKAIANNVVSEKQSETLTDRQIYELVMESGFSTAEVVSDISGRGVGLDVVRNTIESLGGSISIDSSLGEGSKFSIQLPLTLSIISVLLVELKHEKYAIPLSSIIETAIVSKEQVFSAHNKKVIDFRGKVVPLAYLKDIFSVPNDDEEESEYTSVVIVRKGDKLAGLVVDSFIGQQEVVLKALGSYLTDTFAISGATILGDGEVALIIDCNALIK